MALLGIKLASRLYSETSSKILNMRVTYQVACWVQFNYVFVLLQGMKAVDGNATHREIAGDCCYR